jgi:hypothetical protein
MSTDAETPLHKAVDDMVREKFPEGLVRVLERQFPKAAHADLEDAVSTGFEKLVRAGRDIDNPRGYVTTVAVNAVKRILRLAAFEQLAVAVLGQPVQRRAGRPHGVQRRLGDQHELVGEPQDPPGRGAPRRGSRPAAPALRGGASSRAAAGPCPATPAPAASRGGLRGRASARTTPACACPRTATGAR